MADNEPQRIVLDTEEKLAVWGQGREAWNAYAANNPGVGLEHIGEGAVHPVLKGAAAMTLWLKGKKAWNAWVKGNGYADVDFSHEHFQANARTRGGKSWIDFSELVFPRGNVSFGGAKFGEGRVSFRFARFGEGNVSFGGARFGEGEVSFDKASFGNGNVIFDYTMFGGGNVSFAETSFGEGKVSFKYTTFGKGDICFNRTKFGNGNVIFDGAELGEGDVSFDRATFGEGDISFDHATFGEGNVNFGETMFNEGNVNFEGAQFGGGDISFDGAVLGSGEASFAGADFGNGNISFDDVEFGGGDVSFDNAVLNKGDVNFTGAIFGPGAVSLRNLAFEGVARFDYLQNLEGCNLFSFEGCSFDKLFTFSYEGTMGCPLDLRRTKLTHGVVLHDVQCEFLEEPAPVRSAWLSQWFFGYPRANPAAWGLLKRAKDPKDSQRFRRLKELAQSENNRAKALEFNKQELRSQRFHESHWVQNFLQFFYWLCSDYGTSVVRPLWGLLGVTLLFSAVYAALASNPKLDSFMDALPAALTYSGGNMFAFVPIGRAALEQSRVDLFTTMAPYEILWVAGAQSVLSVILLFLLGLGLRNMFRL